MSVVYAKRQANALRFSTAQPLLQMQSENFTQYSNVFCYFCGFFWFFRLLGGVCEFLPLASRAIFIVPSPRGAEGKGDVLAPPHRALPEEYRHFPLGSSGAVRGVNEIPLAAH